MRPAKSPIASKSVKKNGTSRPKQRGACVLVRSRVLEKADSNSVTRPASMQKHSAYFEVMNDKGLHTRPATELVKCSTRFKSQVRLTHQDMVVNAKSLLGILMLAASRGSKILVEAEGEDADLAVKEILQLASNKFNIQY